MSDIVKVAAAAIVAAICAVIVRKQVPEIGVVLAVCACAIILLLCSQPIREIADLLDRLAKMGGVTQDMLKPVMKVIGISVVTRFSSDLCRDAKEGALASTVEMTGSLLALLATFPLLTAVLELLENFI